MPVAGAEIEFVNVGRRDGVSFVYFTGPYNVGGCVDGGRGGVRDWVITCGQPMMIPAVVVS